MKSMGRGISKAILLMGSPSNVDACDKSFEMEVSAEDEEGEAAAYGMDK